MSAIIAFLLSNPTIIAIGGGVIAALGWGFQQRLAGAKAERNAQKAKEADAYEQHLKDLGNAAAAGNAVHAGDSLQHDPFNRDR
jgi:hypothetical protein